MSWAKFDDQFPHHPKILRAGPEAAWLHVCGVCWSARYLTDGRIPKSAIATLSSVREPDRFAVTLVEVGVWHDRGDFYEIHDYLEYNPSKADELARREAARNRQASHRESRTKSRRASQRDNKRSSEVPSPSPTQRSSISDAERRRRAIFGALSEIFGEPKTRTTQGFYGEVATELRDAGEDVTPEEVKIRGKRLMAKNWPDSGPKALSKHWHNLNGSSRRSSTAPKEAALCQECGKLEGIDCHGHKVEA